MNTKSFCIKEDMFKEIIRILHTELGRPGMGIWEYYSDCGIKKIRIYNTRDALFFKIKYQESICQ